MNKPKEVQPDTAGQQNVPQKKKDIKTTLRNLLVLVLVAVVSIVGTLAFLADNSEKKVNTFTGSAGIELELTEPNWTKDDNNDDDIDGETMADSYTPEMVIPKDPTLTNTSAEDCEEWVAMRVDYTFDNDDTTLADLEATVIEKLTLNTGWYKLNTKNNVTVDSTTTAETTKYDIYIYKDPLERKAQVDVNGAPELDDEGNQKIIQEHATLFEQVKIKAQDQLTAAYDSTNKKYKEFKITVYGAAIKNDASIPDTVTEIASDVTSKEINMDNLDALLTNEQKETSPNYSYIIALSLAKLLKTLPNN